MKRSMLLSMLVVVLSDLRKVVREGVWYGVVGGIFWSGGRFSAVLMFELSYVELGRWIVVVLDKSSLSRW